MTVDSWEYSGMADRSTRVAALPPPRRLFSAGCRGVSGVSEERPNSFRRLWNVVLTGYFPPSTTRFNLLGSNGVALTAATPVYRNPSGPPGQRCRLTVTVLPWQPLIVATSPTPGGDPLPPPSVDGGGGQMAEPSRLSPR